MFVAATPNWPDSRALKTSARNTMCMAVVECRKRYERKTIDLSRPYLSGTFCCGVVVGDVMGPRVLSVVSVGLSGLPLTAGFAGRLVVGCETGVACDTASLGWIVLLFGLEMTVTGWPLPPIFSPD